MAKFPAKKYKVICSHCWAIEDDDEDRVLLYAQIHRLEHRLNLLERKVGGEPDLLLVLPEMTWEVRIMGNVVVSSRFS